MRIPSARPKASFILPRRQVRPSSSSSTGLLSISSSPHPRGRSYSQLDRSSHTSSETDPPGWWTLARSPPPSTSLPSSSSSHLPPRSSSSSSISSPTFLDYPLSSIPSPPPSLRYLPRIRPKAEMNDSKISLLPRLFPAGVPVPPPSSSSSSSSLAAISLLPPQPLLPPRYDPQHYGYKPPKFLLSHKPSSASSSPSSSSSRSHPSPPSPPPPPHLAHLREPRPSSDLPLRSPPFASFSSFYATRPGPQRNLRPHLLDAPPPPPAPPKQTPPLLLTPPTPPPLLFISPLTKSIPPPPSFLKTQLGRQSEEIKRKTRLSRRLSSPTPPPPPTLPPFLTLPSVEDRLLRALEGKEKNRKRRNIKKRERRRKVAADVEVKSRSTKQQVSIPPAFLLQAIKLEGSREGEKLAIKRKKTVAEVEVSKVVGGLEKEVKRQQRNDLRRRERRQGALESTSEVLTEESKAKIVPSEEDDAASTSTSPLLAETLRAIAPLLDQHLDVLKSIKLELQAQRCREASPPSTTSELGSPPSQSSSLLAQFSVFGGGKKKLAEEEEVRRIMWKQAQEVGELRKALRQLQDPSLQRDPAAPSPSELGSTWTAQRLRRPKISSETTSSSTHASFRPGDFESSGRSGSVNASSFAAAPFESSEPAPFPLSPNEPRRATNLEFLFKAARSSSDFEVALKVLGSSNHNSRHRDESDFAAFVDASIRLSLVPRAMEVLADPSSGAKAWIHRNSEILPYKLRQMLIALVPESSPSSVSNQDAWSSSNPSLPYTASDLNAFNQHTSILLPAPDFLILAISLRAYYLLGPSGNEGLQAVSSLVLAYQDTFTKPTSRSKNRVEQGIRVTRDLDSIRPFIDPEVMAAFDETQALSTSFHRARLLGIVERVARDLPIGKAIRDLHLPASAIGGMPPDLPPFPKLIEAYLRPSLLAHPDDWFITLLSLYLRRLVGGPTSPVFLEAVENLGVGGEADRWTRGSESALDAVAKMALREIGGNLKDRWGVDKKSLWDDVLGEVEGWTVRMEKERVRQLERDRVGMKSKGSGEMKAVRNKVLGFFER